MRMTAFFQARLRAALRDLRSLLFLILSIAVALAAVSITANVNDDRMILALVNEDSGKYGKMLADDLTAEDYLKTNTMAKDDALLSLKRGRSEAVLIIKDNYSSSLLAGSFENTLDLFSSPASGAGITVSEPAINKTIEFWMAEFARLEASDYLQSQSMSFTAQELQLLKQTHEKILAENPSLQVASEFIDSNEISAGMSSPQIKAEDGDRSIISGPIAVAASWYAIFCLFYLLISSLWLFDLHNSRLLIRAARSGSGRWSIIAVSSSVSLLLSFVGCLAAMVVVAISYGQSFATVIRILPAMLVYLAGALAITLFVGTLLKSTTAVLFLAPAITFINAAMSGLIYPLPEWAVVLRILAAALPGSWLRLALDGSRSAWIGGLLVTFGWLLLGAVAWTLNKLYELKHVSSEAL